MLKNIKKFAPIVIILAVLAATIYYLNWIAREEDELLTASGTVEAVEVDVAIEISGQLAEVLIEEGDPVQQGDILIRFEDKMLRAQYSQAETALVQAQVNYALISA